MKRVEDHLGQARAALHRIDQGLDEVELQLKSKAIQGGMHVRTRLEELRKRRKAVAARLAAAGEEGVEAWERIRGDLEELRSDLARAFANARGELAAHEREGEGVASGRRD